MRQQANLFDKVVTVCGQQASFFGQMELKRFVNEES